MVSFVTKHFTFLSFDGKKGGVSYITYIALFEWFRLNFNTNVPERRKKTHKNTKVQTPTTNNSV